MFRTLFSSHSKTFATVTIVTLAAACSKDGDGKKGITVDVIATAEASPVPTSTVVDKPVRTDSNVLADVTLAKAESAYGAKKYDEAKSMFTTLVDRNPTNGWNHYMLGLSSWKSGDRDGAILSLTNAITIDPKHLKSHLNLARVLLESDRGKDALVHAEKVVKLDSVSLDGFRLLGQIHGKLGNVELAIVSYNKAISIHPKDVSSMNNLAWLLLQNNRVEEALGPLAYATTLEPRNAILQNNLGLALELTGRFVQASAAYKTAILFESGYEKAAESLARIGGRVDDSSVKPVDLKALAELYASAIVGSR